jgi:hypothetical protein
MGAALLEKTEDCFTMNVADLFFDVHAKKMNGSKLESGYPFRRTLRATAGNATDATAKAFSTSCIMDRPGASP